MPEGLNLLANYAKDRKVIEIRIKTSDMDDDDAETFVTELFAKLLESSADVSFEVSIGDE